MPRVVVSLVRTPARTEADGWSVSGLAVSLSASLIVESVGIRL
jgi:hypothetical protein